MIIGIGVDLVDIGRFEETLRRTPALAVRLFAESERDRPPRYKPVRRHRDKAQGCYRYRRNDDKHRQNMIVEPDGGKPRAGTDGRHGRTGHAHGRKCFVLR